MNSLISVAITHAVIKLLTRTHANSLCSHLHVQFVRADRCSCLFLTSACGSDDLILHRNRKLKEILLLWSTRRAPLHVLLIDSKNPWNPLQMCYCSGSGPCNRSEICFSFFHFSLTLRCLSVSSSNSSVCSELLTAVRGLLRLRLQLLIVHQLQQRYFSYCRNLWTKWKHHWLYQI